VPSITEQDTSSGWIADRINRDDNESSSTSGHEVVENAFFSHQSEDVDLAGIWGGGRVAGCERRGEVLLEEGASEFSSGESLDGGCWSVEPEGRECEGWRERG